jgi:hypothetical protein
LKGKAGQKTGKKPQRLNLQKQQRQSKNQIKPISLKSCNAKVENNKIVEYRAIVKIAFIMQREQ